MGDAGPPNVIMGVHPGVTAVRSRPLQPLQPPQPPQPPQRLRVLRGRSISASTEDAALPAVRMAGQVPATAGRVLIRLIITTAGSVFPRLYLRPGIRLVRLGNFTTVITRSAALPAVSMDAHPAVVAARRQPPQPPQPPQ